MAKTPGGNKKTMGSIRAKAGFPAKAGRRRPPSIVSTRDPKTGKRDWQTAQGGRSK